MSTHEDEIHGGENGNQGDVDAYSSGGEEQTNNVYENHAEQCANNENQKEENYNEENQNEENYNEENHNEENHNEENQNEENQNEENQNEENQNEENQNEENQNEENQNEKNQIEEECNEDRNEEKKEEENEEQRGEGEDKNETTIDQSDDADNSDMELKFFLGGIPPDCWEDDVTKYFSGFGKVKEVQIMKDASTGRNRGFCFVTMSDKNSHEAIFNTEHKIKNKKVEVRDMQEQNTKRKVFVGGINAIFTEENLKEYFSKFGEVEKATIMKTEDNKPRGFGFVIFADEKAANEVLRSSSHEISDKYKVEVRAALSRPKYYGSMGYNSAPYGYTGGYSPMYNQSWGRGGAYGGGGFGGYGGYGGGGYFMPPYSPGGQAVRGMGGGFSPYGPLHGGSMYNPYQAINAYGAPRTSPVAPRGRPYRMGPY